MRFVALLFFVGLCAAERHLLEDHLASAVENFGPERGESTTASLSRMLLAYKALEELKPDTKLLNHDPWRQSVLNKDALDPLGLKDYDPLGFKDNAKAHLDGVADATETVVASKKDFVSKVLGVATGELTLEEAASGQIAALTQYLNALIERETRLLDAYSQGDPDDQLSHVLRAPQRNRYIEKILSPFGVLDSKSLIDVTSSLQDRFCSPFVFLPKRSIGHRTVINGPAFEVTFSTGGCELNFDYGDHTLPFPTVPKQTVDCTGPEVSYTKSPITLHKQDILPDAFASSECRIERRFGTAYEKVLYGGGPLVRFPNVEAFIDALVTKKYSVFSGLDEVLDFNLTKPTFGAEDAMEFWSALGPGRLLKDKTTFGSKLRKDLSLSSILDLGQTSPHGFGLKEEWVSPLTEVNLGDGIFSLSKSNIFSDLKERLAKN